MQLWAKICFSLDVLFDNPSNFQFNRVYLHCYGVAVHNFDSSLRLLATLIHEPCILVIPDEILMVLGPTDPPQILSSNTVHERTITTSSYLLDMESIDLKLTEGYPIDQDIPRSPRYLPDSLADLYELLIVRI